MRHEPGPRLIVRASWPLAGRSAKPEAHLLVHCRAGASHSTAAAALILMQANPEWPASAALDAVAAIRPRAWPNLLILEFGDALLGRNGEITSPKYP
jgi:predicted protein tyrosine phosphatase